MLRYVGKGEAMIGIPARDLSDEEVAEFGGEEWLIGTGLYEEVKDERGGMKAVKKSYEDKAILKGDE